MKTSCCWVKFRMIRTGSFRDRKRPLEARRSDGSEIVPSKHFQPYVKFSFLNDASYLVGSLCTEFSLVLGTCARTTCWLTNVVGKINCLVPNYLVSGLCGYNRFHYSYLAMPSDAAIYNIWILNKIQTKVPNGLIKVWPNHIYDSMPLYLFIFLLLASS